MKKNCLIYIYLIYSLISCGTPEQKTNDETDFNTKKKLIETEIKLLESERKLLEQEKSNFDDKKNNSVNSDEFNEKNKVPKRENTTKKRAQNFQNGAESVISNFLEAENSRNFELIYSYYSPYLQKYFSNNNPSYSNMQKTYSSAWASTPYSKNTLLSVDQLTENEYRVKINYEWRKNNNNSVLNSKYDNLKIILDEQNKIVEVSSLK